MTIKWKRSEDGFVDSKCGHWRIRPLFCGRVKPLMFELLRDGVVVERNIPTQYDAKIRATAAQHLEINDRTRPPAAAIPLTVAGKTLTPAQQRVYEAIKAAGEKRYNGHMGKVLRNLRALGLVVFDYDVVLHLRGSTELYVARLSASERMRR